MIRAAILFAFCSLKQRKRGPKSPKRSPRGPGTHCVTVQGEAEVYLSSLRVNIASGLVRYTSATVSFQISTLTHFLTNCLQDSFISDDQGVQKTFLNFASAVKSLVQMGVQRPQKNSALQTQKQHFDIDFNFGLFQSIKTGQNMQNSFFGLAGTCYRVIFLTGTPLKSSKYKKVNLGQVSCMQNVYSPNLGFPYFQRH